MPFTLPDSVNFRRRRGGEAVGKAAHWQLITHRGGCRKMRHAVGAQPLPPATPLSNRGPMEVVGDYHKDGYALIRGMIAPEVGQALLKALKRDLGDGPIPLGREGHVNLLNRPAFDLAGQLYPPLLFFLWGLTPTVAGIVGRDL